MYIFLYTHIIYFGDHLDAGADIHSAGLDLKGDAAILLDAAVGEGRLPVGRRRQEPVLHCRGRRRGLFLDRNYVDVVEDHAAASGFIIIGQSTRTAVCRRWQGPVLERAERRGSFLDSLAGTPPPPCIYSSTITVGRRRQGPTGPVILQQAICTEPVSRRRHEPVLHCASSAQRDG